MTPTPTSLPATKTAYLAELQNKLKGMPDSEIIAATAYYDEYLTDAGPANEAAAIAELGSPAEVAAGIMGDYVYADTTGESASTRKGLNAIWIVVIGILASPIALPLAIALIAVIFSLLISVLSVILSLFVAAGALLFAGVAYLAVGFITLFTSFATGITTMGIGLMAIAVGAALGIGLIWATKHAVNGIAALGSRAIRNRRNKRNGVTL